MGGRGGLSAGNRTKAGHTQCQGGKMRLAAKEARLRISNRGPVLSVQVSGLVTVATIEEIRLHLAPLVERAGAVWVDYTTSVVAASDLELAGLVRPIALGARATPMAWAVADTGTAALWQRQVLRLAFAGQRRFVSCGQDGAAQWAQEQARLGLLDRLR